MDGTLIDSMGYWKNLGREYLRAKGVTDGVDDTLNAVAAMTVGESAAFLGQRFSLGGTPESIADEINRIMDDHYRNDIPLKKGVRAHLNQLKKEGVHMCVASATDEALMEVCLKRLGIFSDFEFILSCETMHTSKREPAIYLEAAKRFHAKPEDVAVYEDALYAVKTAKAAGFSVIGVFEKAARGDWETICGLADEAVNFD